MSMKTYVITIAKQFPSDHMCKGELTNFREKIEAGEKIHTIRTNYDLWAKRIAEVQAGRAVLSLRQWIGKPYNSKQVEIKKLTAADGVGIQKVTFNDYLYSFDIDGVQVYVRDLCANDGLSLSDFDSWFRKVVPYQELAVIHFTSFRYKSMEQEISEHSYFHMRAAACNLAALNNMSRKLFTPVSDND